MKRLRELAFGGKKRLDVAAAWVPAVVPAVTAMDSGADQRLAEMLERTCALVEADIERAVADVTLQNSQVVDRGKQMAQDAATIAAEARLVAVAAGSANAAVSLIADATGEVSAAGREIASQAARSTMRAQAAVAEVDRAAETVKSLQQAARGIGDVLRLIVDIADRTNLLALNATIEAARAGDTGRGFAVVASEVKSLASRTKTMTNEIGLSVQAIRAAADGTVGAMASVGDAVRQMNEANASVAAAVEQQDATIRGIAVSLQEAARDTGGLVGTVESVTHLAVAVGTNAGVTAAAMSDTNAMMDELGGRLVLSLRNSMVGNRRAEVRLPVELAATLTIDGHTMQATVLDLSAGGALLRLSHEDAARVAPKGPARIDIEGLGSIEASRVGGRMERRHLQFGAYGAEISARLAALLDGVQRDDRRFVDAAVEGARRAGTELSRAMDEGRINQSDLFNFTYQPIENTDPPQFLARFTVITDALFPPIQEELVRLDPRVQFAAAVDRNGYLPTHNAKYNQRQRPGDAVWNAANCRSRRIFNDRAGLSAGRCSGAHQLQTYERDMGGGVRLMLKEADAPIMVRGRQWGGFRLCYRAR